MTDALRLDVPSRAQLAVELLGSLDGPTDPGADAAWAVEIEQRVTASEAGAVNLEAWEDVRGRIEREILNRCTAVSEDPPAKNWARLSDGAKTRVKDWVPRSWRPSRG